MRHPDPLIMSADIARVASERPDLGEELVQALYQHLVLIEGRQPAIDELREYVDRLSSLDEHKLRQRLGLMARRKRGPRAPAKPRRGHTAAPGAAVTRDEVEVKHADRHGSARGPGRPGWTTELFWTRYRDACARATPPYIYRSIAPHFETLDGTRGTDPEYVRKLVRRHGRPPDWEPGSVGPSLP